MVDVGSEVTLMMSADGVDVGNEVTLMMSADGGCGQ